MAFQPCGLWKYYIKTYNVIKKLENMYLHSHYLQFGVVSPHTSFFFSFFLLNGSIELVVDKKGGFKKFTPHNFLAKILHLK